MLLVDLGCLFQGVYHLFVPDYEFGGASVPQRVLLWIGEVGDDHKR